MPVIDGKVVRSRYTALKLGELSAVDRPAQPGARAMIMKRDDTPDWDSALATIAKYVGEDDGAHSFSEVLQENKFSEEIWPYTDALSQSIRSIVGDSALAGSEREAKISATVDEFLTAVRGISGEVGKSLEGLISKREVIMPKTVEELQADLSKLQGEHADLQKRLEASEEARKAADKAKADAMEEKDDACAKLAASEKALAEATDETIKVDDIEVRKSVVGETQFKVTKALADKADRAELEKRASDRFPHLTGTAAHKAAALKAVEGIADEDIRKGVEQILDSAEKMSAAGFGRRGVGDPIVEPTRKAAVDAFTEKVAEIKKRDSISEAAAMSKARREFPTEFADYQSALN